MQVTSFTLETFALSDRGHVRKANEDVYSLWEKEGLFVLADGMGGRKGGGLAAKTATAEFYNALHPSLDKVKKERAELFVLFYEAYQKASQAVFSLGKEFAELSGMGTTFCALYFFNHSALLSHVGDSRIYLLRDRKLKQMTQDHTLFGSHILSRVVGPLPETEPAINIMSCRGGDLFLLCSDGLTNSLANEKIEKILQEEKELRLRGEALMKKALKEGGSDNVTFVLVKVRP